jgi:uncharacterized protein (TIGR02996 family)
VTAARDPGFEAALAVAPGDQGLRLIYADFVEEHGDEAYGRALRWLAREGKHPVPNQAVKGAECYFGNDEPDGFSGNYHRIRRYYGPCLLATDLFVRLQLVIGPLHVRPGLLVSQLSKYDHPFHLAGQWAYFSSVQQATEYLARALEFRTETES